MIQEPTTSNILSNPSTRPMSELEESRLNQFTEKFAKDAQQFIAEYNQIDDSVDDPHLGAVRLLCNQIREQISWLLQHNVEKKLKALIDNSLGELVNIVNTLNPKELTDEIDSLFSENILRLLSHVKDAIEMILDPSTVSLANTHLSSSNISSMVGSNRSIPDEKSKDTFESQEPYPKLELQNRLDRAEASKKSAPALPRPAPPLTDELRKRGEMLEERWKQVEKLKVLQDYTPKQNAPIFAAPLSDRTGENEVHLNEIQSNEVLPEKTKSSMEKLMASERRKSQGKKSQEKLNKPPSTENLAKHPSQEKVLTKQPSQERLIKQYSQEKLLVKQPSLDMMAKRPSQENLLANPEPQDNISKSDQLKMKLEKLQIQPPDAVSQVPKNLPPASPAPVPTAATPTQETNDNEVVDPLLAKLQALSSLKPASKVNVQPETEPQTTVAPILSASKKDLQTNIMNEFHNAKVMESIATNVRLCNKNINTKVVNSPSEIGDIYNRFSTSISNFIGSDPLLNPTVQIQGVALPFKPDEAKRLPLVLMIPIYIPYMWKSVPLLEPIYLGRSNTANIDPCAIGFPSQVVSRSHAQLFYYKNRVYAKDIGSNGGTFLNGVRLSVPGVTSQPFECVTGDILQLGVDYKPKKSNLGPSTAVDKDPRHRCIQLLIVTKPENSTVFSIERLTSEACDVPEPAVRIPTALTNVSRGGNASMLGTIRSDNESFEMKSPASPMPMNDEPPKKPATEKERPAMSESKLKKMTNASKAQDPADFLKGFSFSFQARKQNFNFVFKAKELLKGGKVSTKLSIESNQQPLYIFDYKNISKGSLLVFVPEQKEVPTWEITKMSAPEDTNASKRLSFVSDQMFKIVIKSQGRTSATIDIDSFHRVLVRPQIMSAKYQDLMIQRYTQKLIKEDNGASVITNNTPLLSQEPPQFTITGDFKEGRFIYVLRTAGTREQMLAGRCSGKEKVKDKLDMNVELEDIGYTDLLLLATGLAFGLP